MPEHSASHFLNLIRKERRGRFKLYIGMSAGVGKTYRMLQEAHELMRRGVNVQIGVAVTHNRPDTVQMAQGLPALPLKKVYYKGKELEELDVEGILLARPEVVLVDELAHTNAPGSPNEKRWQDVEQLLAAGINVISALNIQHIESLHPAVMQITGIDVTERVPDRILTLADDVVNIDLTAEDLIQRLREGKIYEPGKVEAALVHFFRPQNLLQLRELAMREVANALERHIEHAVPGGQRPQARRICVCVSTNEKTGKHLIRRTARLADVFGPKWYVVYVQTAREDPTKINLAAQRHLINNLKLATELGAEVVQLRSDDVALALVQFARERDVSLLVTGKTRRNWWQIIRHGDLMKRLIRLSEPTALDIMIVS